ncbi:hypothetical protein TrST_g7502 [Triparma strigata]|uniref:ER membrane protein complex subunit 10 n=1 Tax=Triparma strigata TaxID=1606541 RepID=A0A9W7E5Y7_9STRA|nr:hypothetical protein TrST_g7502 [Triparma strigata]
MEIIFLLFLAVVSASVSSYEYSFQHQIIHASGRTTATSSGLSATWDGESGTAIVASELDLSTLDFEGVSGTPDTWFYAVSTDTSSYSFPFCPLLANTLSPKLRLSLTLSPGFTGDLSSFNLRVTNKLIDATPSPLCSSTSVEAIKGGLKPETATNAILLLPETSDVIDKSVRTRAPPGMIPLKRNKDEASDITFEKAKGEGSEKAAGGQSILGKYWWIILPLAVMTLTAPAEEAPQAAKAK